MDPYPPLCSECLKDEHDPSVEIPQLASLGLEKILVDI